MIQRRRPAGGSTPSSGPGSGFSSPAPTQQNASYQPLRHDTGVSTPPRFGQAPSFTPRANHVHNSSLGGYGNGFSPMMGSNRAGMTGLGQYVEENESGPVLRRVGRQIRAGVKDMAELNRSWSLVWGDPELRTRVLKVTTVNLISLLLLSLLPLMAPVLSQSSRAAKVGFWYNVLLNWPMFAVCFAVNAYWGPGVAKRAQAVMHPAHRTSSSTSEIPSAPSPALLTLTRAVLIGDFTLISRSLVLIPLIGRPLALAYMTLVNAYYAYEWIFANRDWPLGKRCAYIGDRAAYMFGFGLIPTLLTSFFPPLINMAIFTLLYPFLLIQALHSRPPAAGDVLPAGSGAGQDDTSAISPALGVRVPIFVLAQNALVGAEWLMAALGRQRGEMLGRLREKMSGKY